MNRQLVFENAWNGIKAQDFERSIRDNYDLRVSKNPVICAYRGGDGCKCFVGHNIPDTSYRPELEGLQVLHNIVRGALDPVLGVPTAGAIMCTDGDSDYNFLRDGQIAHDNGLTPRVMEQNLRQLAAKYGLVVPA